MIGDLEAALTLRSVTDGYSARISEHWAQGRATFGGLVAALGVRSMQSARTLRSVFVQFVGPIAPEEVHVASQVLRAGKSASHCEATLRQGGAVLARILSVYGDARVSTVALPAPRPPSLGARDATPIAPFVEGLMPSFTRYFEFAWPTHRLPFAAAPEDATFGGWIRCPSAVRADAALVLCLADAWPAPTLRALSGPTPASSVNWKIDFSERAFSFEPNAFLRFESRTYMHEHGYSTIEGDLWTEEGVHVARSSQLVAVFG